jgi:hypothetical protein
MSFEEYIIQERGEVFYKDSIIDKNKLNSNMPLEEWFKDLYAEYEILHGGMKIKVKRVDPGGGTIKEQELDTIINFPWQSEPVFTEAGNLYRYEQRKKWRCVLEIGGYEYYVHRDGRLEQLGGFKGDDK